MEDLTGRQLGPYRIMAPLGEGGMAAVFKAYQPNIDRYVALKILPRYFASDPTFVGRFEQEAKVVARLQHPHILPVHNFGEADGYTYIVMPFVESGTLADLMRKVRLRWLQIQSIISQVGDALDYAHSLGVVHRDVKPNNILVDQRGNCLLSDFGIAKIVEGTTAFTRTGGSIGTPAYMSPEQIRAEKLDGRSDIYSLGIVLYEMATGRVPFSAETPPAIFVKHLHDPLPPPHIYRADIPEEVERVILKSLAKEPEDRYNTANEMAMALAKGLTSRPAAVRTTEAGPRRVSPSAEAVPASKRRGLTLLPWVLALLGILLAGGVIITLSGLLQPDQGAAHPATLAPIATSRMGTPTDTLVTDTTTPGSRDTATARASPPASPSTVTVTLLPATRTYTPQPTLAPTRTLAPTPPPTIPASATPVPTSTPTPLPSATNTSTPTPTTPPPTTAGPAGVRIAGRVLWGDAPVPGARAQLRTGGYYDTPVLAEAVVDATGQFSIANPPAGAFQIYAVAPSDEYWSWTGRPVEIPVGGDVNAGTFYLSKKLQLLEPADGATVGTTTPALRWSGFPDAARYHVDVFNDGTGDAVLRQDTTDTSLIVSPPLTPGVRYQWSVDAYNAAGNQIAYYSAWRFLVQP
jgi:serine/threonine protein kinase